MNDECDLLVIGSGSAALSAALRALDGGLKVTVVEKSGLLGGTSAMSGAGIWIPANHIARKNGISDSREEALTYLHASAPDGWADDESELWSAFAQNAPDALEFIDKSTPIELEMIGEPDAIAELPGGKTVGRMVSPKPISRNILGKYRDKIRRSTIPHWITYKEQIDQDPYHHPIRFGITHLPKILHRLLTNSGAQGTALMTSLIRGCMDRNCTFLLETRALNLVADDSGRIIGAVVEAGGETRTLQAPAGVVVATGGFEWNTKMREEHFPGPVDRIGSPRTNEGDGQRMVAEIGAKLDRMDQANIYPALPIIYEGKPQGIPMTYQTEPHSIIVNRHAKRFVSETNFNIGEAMDQRDPETGQSLHLPAWLVGDSRFIYKSMPFHWYARQQPGWILKAATIDELAEKTGLSAEALTETIERFNGFCDGGRDLDFHRGESAFEDYKTHGAENRLGRIDKPPYYAMSFNRVILGTKGGARTNAQGQVLRADGSIIAGLYAAGLAMANPIGTRAIGAGTTIGPNLTWGYICAETILRQNQPA